MMFFSFSFGGGKLLACLLLGSEYSGNLQQRWQYRQAPKKGVANTFLPGQKSLQILNTRISKIKGPLKHGWIWRYHQSLSQQLGELLPYNKNAKSPFRAPERPMALVYAQRFSISNLFLSNSTSRSSWLCFHNVEYSLNENQGPPLSPALCDFWAEKGVFWKLRNLAWGPK